MSTDEGVRVDPDTPADGMPSTTDDAPVAGDPGTTGATGEPAQDADAAPRFWHRAHPVFTPLAGFFTGMVTILVVLAALGWLLDRVLGYDVADHPWVFLLAVGVVFLVNLVLVALPGTRRFARYMLFGVLVTPTVVAVVAVATTYLLIRSDG